eukprot:TRINITY_DN5810_c0_g1_i4.p1 TRINITY_DN5810_c0_g1~~TRINITY_DN5810_c0_g1_i4.p1  ORF type:complete len:535 (+),score=37.11 TRINITY_DN5810_c0_g1_i4:119-1606(+)
MEGAEERLLQALNAAPDGAIGDSGEWAASADVDHAALVGTIKSLVAHEMIHAEEVDHQSWALTAEAQGYLDAGSPEAQVFAAVPDGGIPLDQLKSALGPLADIGMKQAMANKWLAVAKGAGGPLVSRKVPSVDDRVQQLLKAVQAGESLPPPDLDFLHKKRKLVAPSVWKTYRLAKGPKFALQKKKAATDLTREMMQSGAWKSEEFKPYNFNALGMNTEGGHLHPLLKVRAQFRKIFLEMGFEEMPTNNFVESSFWNFDALFQPQQHPARDSHDTFFLKAPASTTSLPEDYLQRVKTMHETGGHGSTGYGYDWKREEAEKNLLRTHTTAVSSRMLFKLAQDGFRPAKYFSIDRVFRNEAVDRTHLAEFHQIEGVICDRGTTLGDLIGVLNQFFARLGITRLRFKPAYNPYTEPSMEIFSYHEQLKKWVEVGNSGMFRPEMLQPMGLPDDVSVIAWGLSLERPTMILYHIDNIRDLFGHKVDLKLIKSNPICRLGL